jgi:dolichol-phosphate mannosyltransferase
VYSQRSLSGETYWRRIQSGVYIKFISWFTGNKVNHRLGSFTAINRNVATEYGKFTEPDHHFLYLLNWLGFKSVAIEIERSPRLHGKSSYRFQDRVKHAARGALFFSSRIVAIVSLIGLLVVLSGLILLVFLFVRSLGVDPVSGWLSLISSVIVLSGLNILLTSIFCFYIVRTYENSKNRPLYVISEEI